MARKSISPRIQARVLNASRRRCCICFALERDFGIKQGQIAHLDRDHANASESNFAFLCLPHHDQYDSKPSQSKRYTAPEVRRYREELYQSIVPVLDARLTVTALPRGHAASGAAAGAEAGLAQDECAAIREYLERAGPAWSVQAIAHKLGLAAKHTELRLRQMSRAGIVRVDRDPGTLRRVYSLQSSRVNRILNAFVTSFGKDVSTDRRYVRRRMFEVDAVVTTRHAEYAADVIIPADSISYETLRRHAVRLQQAIAQLSLNGAIPVLLVDRRPSESRLSTAVARLARKGIIARLVDVGPA